MKKYIFIFFVLVIAGSIALNHWPLAGLFSSLLFIWLAWENHLRTRFRFLDGSGFFESHFDLGADITQFEIAGDGSCAVFLTLDGVMSMRDMGGREIWRRPSESGILALLAVSDGGCYYALGDELVRCGPHGNVERRISFSAPPFRQSYRLMLSADGGTLLLHTPWFFHFFSLDLQSAGQRVSCEETGHYLKYAAVSGAGDRIFFAGAKLLEEEQSAEARWGSWVLRDGSWKPDWSGASDSYGNSHLRGVAISRDGKTLLLELYQERYEVRIYSADGTLRLRKEGVEHPTLSPDTFLMLWENKGDGLVLGDLNGKLKLWNRLGVEKIRHKRVDNSGKTFAIEGMRLLRLEQNGDLLAESWFIADPFRMVSSADGSMLAVVRQSKGGFVGLPPA